MLSDGLCFNFSSANMNYCEFVATLPDDTDNPNKHYHDTQYGFPIEDDNELFERLVLEINQAGLSWTLMLKKQQAFQTAFKGLTLIRSPHLTKPILSGCLPMQASSATAWKSTQPFITRDKSNKYSKNTDHSKTGSMQTIRSTRLNGWNCLKNISNLSAAKSSANFWWVPATCLAHTLEAVRFIKKF